MSKLLTKTLAFVLFSIFMVNMVAWSFSSNRLAHEIDSTLEGTQLALAHGASHQHDVMDAGDGDAPSVSEHQLLHAVDHLQLFLSTVFYGMPASIPSAFLSQYILRTLPPAALDPPFRPPRSISFLA